MSTRTREVVMTVHRWRLKPGERAWVGDRVTVTLIEDDPDDEVWGTADPPPDDRSTQ